MERKWVAAFTLSVLLIASALVVVTRFTPTHQERQLRNVPPISIQRDTDFDADHGVVRGSGTISDPYLIEGWNIDTSVGGCSGRPCAGIAVRNVSSSFIIRNVKVRGGPYDDGLSLSAVNDARLESASITVGGGGIRIAYSTDLTILGNVVVGSNEGISLTRSQNIYVVANNITRGSQGILVEDSSRVVLLNNMLSENDANGILLSHAVNSTIEGNTINETAFRAIALFDSSKTVVNRNQIISSGEECLYLLGGGGNTVIQNELSSCEWAGISVMRSNDNVLKDNFVAATPWGIALYESCGNLVARNRVANASVGNPMTASSDCNLVVDSDESRSAVAGSLSGTYGNRAAEDQSDAKAKWREYESELSLGKVLKKRRDLLVFRMSLE